CARRTGAQWRGAAAAILRGRHRVLGGGVLVWHGGHRPARGGREGGSPPGGARCRRAVARGTRWACRCGSRKTEGAAMNPKLPDSFRKIVGEMPPAGRLPDGNASPFETIRPAREGHVERDGVRCWYAVWGDTGPWLAFASPLQMVHSQVLKATVPYLSEHFRVIT